MGIEIRECEAKCFLFWECLPHWRNAGGFSLPGIGMLSTMLNREMWKVDVGSRYIGE